MFAKLKKKIEDEVGDLGQLASPLANPFGAAADRRVGGSSQGSNTPNNLGSRQSSVASLVDLHPIDEHSPSNPSNSLSVNTTRTSNSAAAARQKQMMESTEVELKKVNAEWAKKMEALKKTYEDRIQNQEADFAWKYSSKDDELEKVRVEKKKLEENLKTIEAQYQSKMSRIQEDMDQLEGFAKQEMAKVKHLLLNTQADLQKTKCDLVESESKVKEISEENRNLKAEHESMVRNFDRDKLQRVRFDSGQGDSKAQITDLQSSKQQLENEIRTLQEDILSKNKKIEEFEKATQARLSEKQGELDAYERKFSDLETNLETEKANSSSLSQQVSEIQNSKLQVENDLKVRQEELASKNIVVAHLQEQVMLLKSEKEKEVEQFKNSKSELEKEIQVVKNELKSKQDEIQELQQQRENLQQNGASTNEEISKLSKSNSDLQNQIKILTEDLESKKVQLNEMVGLKEEISAMKNLNAKLETDFKSLTEEKNTLENKLKNEIEQKTEFQKEIKKLQKQVTDLNSDVSNYSVSNSELTNRLEEVQNSKEKLETQVSQLNSSLASKQDLIEELRNTSSEGQSDAIINDLEQQIAELNNQLEEKCSKESTLQSHASELKNSNDKLKNQIEKLREDYNQETAKIKETSRQSEEKMSNIFKQQISDLQTQVDKYANLNEERTQLLTQITDLKSSKVQLDEKVDKLKDEAKLKEEQRVELENHSEGLKKKISDLEVELANAKENLQEFDEARNTNQGLENQILLLTDQIKTKEEKISEMEGNSVETDKQSERLQQTLAELESKLKESNGNMGALLTQFEAVENTRVQSAHEINQLKQELEERDKKLEALDNQSKEFSIREGELLREIQSFETLKIQLEDKIKSFESESSTNATEFQDKITQLETQLRNAELEAAEHNDVLVQVSELQSTTDELEEEIKFLKEEVKVRDTKIASLEEKNNSISTNSNANGNNSIVSSTEAQVHVQNDDDSEEKESLRERIRELESQLGDKNKALKLRQQQLQDLRKSLAKEIRNSPADSISKSGSQNSLRELEVPNTNRAEDLGNSQPETEPAVIQTSISHSNEASNCTSASEDVNFQYMRSVIFKYVTSSDPQMTHHLTKVVSTLLHLNDEEQRLLQKSTDRRFLHWLPTRDNLL